MINYSFKEIQNCPICGSKWFSEEELHVVKLGLSAQIRCYSCRNNILKYNLAINNYRISSISIIYNNTFAFDFDLYHNNIAFDIFHLINCEYVAEDCEFNGNIKDVLDKDYMFIYMNTMLAFS